MSLPSAAEQCQRTLESLRLARFFRDIWHLSNPVNLSKINLFVCSEPDGKRKISVHRHAKKSSLFFDMQTGFHEASDWPLAAFADSDRKRDFCGYVKVCSCAASNARRYLLEQTVLHKINRHSGPHVRNVLREQGMHQMHEFTGSEYESTFVLILGDLVVLAPVESLVLQVEKAEPVSTHDEVVATVRVADLGHTRVLRDKATTGAFCPGDAKVLGQVFVLREARDVDDLGQEVGSDDKP
jgi:hypothetical protein